MSQLFSVKYRTESGDANPYAGGLVGLFSPNFEDYRTLYVNQFRNKATISANGVGTALGMFQSGLDGVSAGGVIGSDVDNSSDALIKIYKCVNEGSVTASSLDGSTPHGTNAFAGGIIGCHNSDGVKDGMRPVIESCVNLGAIKAEYLQHYSSRVYAGGIVAYCYEGFSSGSKTYINYCVDNGSLEAEAVGHISASDGYTTGCMWGYANEIYGVRQNKDSKGYYTDSAKALSELAADSGHSLWFVREDGKIDLDF